MFTNIIISAPTHKGGFFGTIPIKINHFHLTFKPEQVPKNSSDYLRNISGDWKMTKIHRKQTLSTNALIFKNFFEHG
jgi:hypothetical protein